MTQEDKELLKDLCARLPYGVICYWITGGELTSNITEYNGQLTSINKVEIEDSSDYYYDCYFNVCNDSNGNSFRNENVPIEIVKPYLRPMSSMTEEEIKEYKHLVAFSGSPDGTANFIDWLNKKMFAYRTIDGKDMFELGLVLKAPEGMYTDDKFVPITKEELEKTRINSKDYLI